MFGKFQILPYQKVSQDFSSKWALRVGLPFARGTTIEQLEKQIVSCDSQSIQQSSWLPTALWNDGSVRWACIDLVATPNPHHGFYLTAKDSQSPPNRRLPESIDWSPQWNRGNLELKSAKTTSQTSQLPIAVSVHVSGNWGTSVLPFVTNANSCSGNQVSVDFDATASLKVETLSLAIEFRLSGRCWCTGQIDLALQICNPNPADHPGGNWDLGNLGSVYLNDLTLRLGLPEPATADAFFVREELESAIKTGNTSIELFQAASGGDNWKSSNHLDRNRRVPMQFPGYRLCVDQIETEALRATPYVAIESGGLTLAVACKRFWQNFPMAIRAFGRCIEVGLLPKECQYEHELQGGEQKTFQFAAYIGNASAKSFPLDGYLSDPIPVIAPDYMESTGTLGGETLSPSKDAAGMLYERLVNQAIEGTDSFFAKREKIDEYGWRHYGDVYGDHEAVYHQGPTPMISHYNNQYDCVLGFFYQFLRSGDPRWYEQLISMADHAWDIDTYHTNEDKLLYNGGLFWHTYHYADADTGTHRSYPRSLLEEDHFESGKDLGAMGKTGQRLKKVYGKGGGPAASQNYSTGWMYAYYLTGEPRYKAAAINAADYVIRIEDGSKTPFRWLSMGPTGYATCSSDGYYGPGRASANSTLALLTGYELTADRKYLDMAVGLMYRTVHPTQNLDRLDLLNAELRWFYTMYLQALCRMIDVLEQDPTRESEFEYAVASLMHYTRWMVSNERPILDTPEKLQYPTETWAAQDIRKWHVLAYAARWCSSEQEGKAMMDKAEWFYQYVTRTLDGFETKSVCRPVVLLMNYGWQRAGSLRLFQEQGLRRMRQKESWPEMEHFVPQKQIALRRAKLIAVALGTLTILGSGWVIWWLISSYLRALPA